MLPADLRLALRTLARNPGFAIVALITLVLGIGANTAVFSMVQGVLLSPLPFARPDRLVSVREVSIAGRDMRAAWRNFEDWRSSATHFDELVAHSPGSEETVLGAGEALRASAARVSEGFFRTLGIQPAHGRGFAPEDHRLGAAPVAVVSDRFWQTHLGERDLSLARVTVASFQMQVVGVMAPGFAYPADVDIWYPLELDPGSDSRTSHNYLVLGRLAPDATLAQADAELDAVTQRFRDDPDAAAEASQFPQYFPGGAQVESLRDALVGDTRRPLLVLLTASLLVLLLACTNLASTTLARGTARQRDYAIRFALGAGRGRIVRAIVVETLVLALAGVAAGLVLAAVLLRPVLALAPPGLPRLGEIRLDGVVVLFATALSVATVALAGLLPAIRIARSASAMLRSGGRAGHARSGQRIWKALVACEMALALVLLTGSGLLLRSFLEILDIEPGFRTRGVLMATVNPPSSEYADLERRRQYFDALLSELEALRGVDAVGLIALPPMVSIPNGQVDVDRGTVPNLTASYQLVSPGYFRAMDIALVRGRNFADADGPTADHVVIVNEALAREAWPGQDPIGKRITAGGMDNFWQERKWATVVGVVASVRQRELSEPAVATMYFPYRQRPFRAWAMTAAVRPATGESSALASVVREAVRAIDVDVPVRITTIEEQLSGSLAPRRFVLVLIGAFAAIALFLGSVGVYGVVGYAVQRRRREIGIRIALGALPSVVRRQLQRDYLIAGAVGAAAGLLLSIALTRSLDALLFEVRPTDPLTFAAVLILLGVVSWTASFVPSVKGTRMDPLEAMRED